MPRTTLSTVPHDPSGPPIRALSLGAGVQSSCLLLLSAHGVLPKLDYAAFADPGWERPETYAALDRLEREVATPAGIPIVRLSAGDIRRDALDPNSRFSTMPLFIKNTDGSRGMLRRQCTSTYKIKILLAEARRQLGAETLPGGRAGRTKRGRYLEQWIGISTDEFTRAKDSGVSYARNIFPLLDLGMSRTDCERYLAEHGFQAVSRSACVGCPYTSDKGWRTLRDQHPGQWAQAVAFDKAIRSGSARATANGVPLRGQAYLHPSLRPLDEAPIDPPHVDRKYRRLRLVDTSERWKGDPDGCSPWACRSGSATSPVASALGLSPAA
ncbi:MAG TPA: hypothetical protein VGS97_17025 [Actinocrinis sp.]|uniref:hypothetical protein n=1 Tax=Actinocrinis sp. TaxID=1920516 RepID=UPI002DDD9240|nr:hypothetical protein [Actinocrinis sp.]HEV2345805.1 hypothetical protein [Actinocrinis sp.]